MPITVHYMQYSVLGFRDNFRDNTTLSQCREVKKLSRVAVTL